MSSQTNYTSSKEHLPDLKSAKHLSERVASTRIVFRVFDTSSFRGYDPATGFEASGFDENPFFDETQRAEAHLNWANCTVVTPWISTTRRWLWAVWEMNRRFGGSFSSSPTRKRSSTGIKVAVIDLEVCRRSSPKPPVHALSVLSPTSEQRNFANLSDEILIYGSIPPAAIISIWTYEKTIGIAGLPGSISLHMPTGSYLAYRDVHARIVESLDNPPELGAWTAREGGEKCAKIVISMLQGGYKQLEEQLDKMIRPIRETRAWAATKTPGFDDQLSSLTQGMGALSTQGTAGEVSNPGINGGGSALSHTMEDAIMHMNKGAYIFQKTITRARQDLTRATQAPNDPDPEYSESTILDAYTALAAHRKSVHDRLSGSKPNPNTTSPFTHAFDQLLRLELSCLQTQQKCYEVLIVRLARQKIERLRSVALEFARTVPLGLVDRFNVDRFDWASMRWSMMGCVDAWLVPLEKKLDGLEDRVVSGLLLQAKMDWLGNEQRYPKWWEFWGNQLTVDGTEQTRAERYYTYLANEV
ncbi:unnamed protein product [Rhizoctonia solani]|uniref:DUF7587 domain-containing protein n=1 Tax=Rhizoctonia solani TaxID=456999 RepID=A0A8H2WLD9_9AGAM|nr:unnamed protein product [Rhizoctonia solani]